MGEEVIRIYRYKQLKVLKNGEIKEYDQTFTKKIQKPIANLSENERTEIYKEFLRGRSKTGIAADFGTSIYHVRKVICEHQSLELTKIST